jgi:hypothetical protein
MNTNFLQSGVFFFFAMLFAGAVYVFGAYVLYRVGSKLGPASFGEYCIPVYNQVLLCRCAGISPWLLLLLLVPLGNLGFIVYLWGTLAAKLGHNFWLFGVGTMLIGIPALVLAFDSSQPVSSGTTITFAEPSISCIAGEFAGSQLPVRTSGLVIGRNAGQSNVVLSSPEVSAAHARLWSDAEGRVWLDDMSSTNGTFYSRPLPDGVAEWMEVKGPVALSSGSHIRLGESADEFVVN